MKNFNRIVFLSSFMMISVVSAMEMELTEGNWFVELDSNQRKQLASHVEGNMRYYKEYIPQRDSNNNFMVFPVRSTDPLLIEHCGDKRFFVTSATEEKKGAALTILDPAIKQLVVVRGLVESNRCRVNVYLGLETDKVRLFGFKGRHRIYPARIMKLQIQNGKSEYPDYPIKPEVESFEIENLQQEIDKLKEEEQREIELEEKKIQQEIDEIGESFPKDLLYAFFPAKKREPFYTCFPVEKKEIKQQEPISQDQIEKLLGKQRAKDFDFEKQCFIFNENYWTDEENKLKGITYK